MSYTTPTANPPNPQANDTAGYQPTDMPSSAPGPIGVPQGYEPPFHQAAHFRPREIVNETQLGTVPLRTTEANHPVYVDGDELKPRNEPHAVVVSLQEALVKAGYLDPGTFHKGIWDGQSAAAYKLVLAEANGYGANAKDTLNALVMNAPAKVKGQRAPYAMTAPADIQAAVSGGTKDTMNVAQRLLGRDLPVAETQAFTQWYQDQERQARTAYDHADLSGGAGNTYTDKPALDAAAAEYIKQHNLADQVAYGTASRMFDFFNMLDGVG